MGSSPYWAINVVSAINLVLVVFALIVELAAFVHCLTQRSDAFSAIGTLPKGGWLALLGVALVFSLLALQGGGLFLFVMIGIAAAGVYLLDVRPGLRDVADGHGPW
jgi:membrane protease YdiL (CAAX protease family)